MKNASILSMLPLLGVCFCIVSTLGQSHSYPDASHLPTPTEPIPTGESSPPRATGSSIVTYAVEELGLARLSPVEQRDARPNPAFQTTQRGGKKNPRDETGDPTQAQKHYDSLLKKARDGDVRAQFDAGMALLTGEGTARDPAAAAEWFRRAADSGDPQAQTQLGYLYAEGLGVERDSAKAARWFLRAAVSGYAPAEYDLGMAYLDGIGAHEDAPEGIRWLLKAAKSWCSRGAG
jgi:TPR repeat protein